MPENCKSRLVSPHERKIHELLEEIRAADDGDLWEEAASKLTDVRNVYRDAMKAREQKAGDASGSAFGCAFAPVFIEEMD